MIWRIFKLNPVKQYMSIRPCSKNSKFFTNLAFVSVIHFTVSQAVTLMRTLKNFYRRFRKIQRRKSVMDRFFQYKFRAGVHFY